MTSMLRGDSFDTAKRATIAQAAEAAAALPAFAKAGAGQAQRFTAAFWDDVPAQDMANLTPEGAAAIAASVWALAAERQPGRAVLRLWQPEAGAAEAWGGQALLAIVNDDMPFLVDSVSAAFSRAGVPVETIVHPILPVLRDDAGRMVGLAEPGAMAAGTEVLRESMMLVAFAGQPSGPVSAAEGDLPARLEAEIAAVLQDVRLAVTDWRPMRARLAETIRGLRNDRPSAAGAELEEAVQFLRWLGDDHFTFLGVRDYRLEDGASEARLQVVPGSGLGILRDEDVRIFDGMRDFAQLPAEVQSFLGQPRTLMVVKSGRIASVHRAVPMDAVLVKTFDEIGTVVGEQLFLGLFTSTAYSRSPRDIPLLRQKVDKVLERSGLDPRSHNGKALRHILDTYPRDELFQISEDDLLALSQGMLHMQERQRAALFLRRDPFERFVSALVFVPRDRFDTTVRIAISRHLERALHGFVTGFSIELTESLLARIHLQIATEPGRTPPIDAAKLEAEVVELTRDWRDRLGEALLLAHGERGRTAALRWQEAFPAGYREQVALPQAVVDVSLLEEALANGALTVGISSGEGTEDASLRLIHRDKPLELSAILPPMEALGLRARTEVPYRIVAPDGTVLWLHDFHVALDPAAAPLSEVRRALIAALHAVWSGATESDGFNRLVLIAGLDWREAMLLRAYARYLRQARLPQSQEAIAAALATHPAIALRLVALFHARLCPRRRDAARAEALEAELTAAMAKVASSDDDEALSAIATAIRATLRTDFYKRNGGHGPASEIVSLKLDSGAMPFLPLPRPFREIFVYSSRVEAVHLRGGRVARGGIRWSDRREDFRTEILDLMKAQQVKNSVIVPVGSKGGFVVKQQPPASAGREAVQAEVIACYRLMMQGLLGITDTVGEGGSIVAPEQVVRLDGDDPYLVVAADKGTATFSDIANGISEEHGFWLGDAFASGGSAGYDHKAMGITARGAWEAVKRHFREIGTDIQTADFTVVGVGDMSGDVFGNGMLLSRHIRLLAAFDHRHIFCDPNPDAATSFAERERLFALPRSSWADYDASLLSEGGAIYERNARSLTVTPQIAARFGLAAQTVTPAALMRAILKAEADLLWFGGIGTYVKAAHQSHADAGDKTNDALRVDAMELRAKVIGEGANLGVTQAGRVEFCLAGGAMNTDAIDNSAGVDTSDHEVNIKILLTRIEAEGRLTRADRNTLLASMTDDVAAHVLRDNYLQTQALSVEQAKGLSGLDEQIRLMEALEKQGRLDRAISGLPDAAAVDERRARSQALTRPELAVLLAHAKMALYDALLDSDLVDDPSLSGVLESYFPPALLQRYPQDVAAHPLRREIIATVLTNELVNRTGPTFPLAMAERTGASLRDIAATYPVLRDVLGLGALWCAIEAEDNRLPAAAQTRALADIADALAYGTGWLLAHARLPLQPATERQRLVPVLAALEGRSAALMSEDEALAQAERMAALAQDGMAAPLANGLLRLPLLLAAFDVAAVAEDAGAPVEVTAQAYAGLAHALGLGWLRRAAAETPAATHWERQARQAASDDLADTHARLTGQVLRQDGGLESWLAAHTAEVDAAIALMAELRRQPAMQVAMLTVAAGQLRKLLR